MILSHTQHRPGQPRPPIQVLSLHGAPRTRGRIHGETLRSKIHEMVGLWKENIAQDIQGDPDLFLDALLAETHFLPVVQRWTPDLLAEVEGIAEGAALDFKTIFCRQLSDEEPWFRLEKKLGKQWGLPEHCTALGVEPQAGLPALVAQNMDTPAYYDGFQVLLHITEPESALEIFMFTLAGKINLAGMNNGAVGICCNTVLALDYRKDGLPEDFVVRGALAQHTLEDALAFMRLVPHASGQNYVLGGRQRVVSLECSAHKAVAYRPYAGANRVYHTNHPLVNDEQGIFHQRLAAMTPEQRVAAASYPNSIARFATLERHFGDPAQTITLEKIKAVLSSHEGPVCHDSSSKVSLGCLIMELDDTPTLHLSPGPPDSTPFATHHFAQRLPTSTSPKGAPSWSRM